MFTDASVACEGPAADGPGLAAWAAGVLDGTIADVPPLPPELRGQLRALTGATFPTRQLQSVYLEWFFRRAVSGLGPDVRVTVHRDTAVRIGFIDDGSSAAGHRGGYRLRLDGGGTVDADVVVSALGHTDSVPDEASAGRAAFAARHGGFHAAPAYTTDVDYSGVAAGQDVIVSGMGLAFVDLVVLLTEGRGGRFNETPDGGLAYVPSGAEPRLWAGSRRGVPYHSKITSTLRGDAAADPRFFTAAAVQELLAQPGELDFHTQLWPLIAKDAGYGYYRELFTGYPERVSISWDEFSDRFAALDWYSPDRERLVLESVPDAEFHLDFEQLDRPLTGLDPAGRDFGGPDDVQRAVAGYIEDDLRLRTSPDHSETLALFTALLKVYMDLGRLVPAERLNAQSQQAVHGWWHGFFSFVDSGPPPQRLRQLLALHRAGHLQFLGPGLEITADEASGKFVASSAHGAIRVSATALIEARLPAPAVAGSGNPLLRYLHSSGLGSEQTLLTADGLHATGRLLVSGANELVSPLGEPNRTLFAVGPNTSGWGAGAFARPGTNATPFRENDALARRILGLLAQELRGDSEHGEHERGDVEAAAVPTASGKAQSWNN
jgi:hypothetical protein